MKRIYGSLLLLCLVGAAGLSITGCSVFHSTTSLVPGETVPLADVSTSADGKVYCDAVAIYLNKITDPKFVEHITVMGFQKDMNYEGGPNELSGEVTLDVKNVMGAYAQGINTRFAHFKKENGTWVCDGISTSPSLPIIPPSNLPNKAVTFQQAQNSVPFKILLPKGMTLHVIKLVQGGNPYILKPSSKLVVLDFGDEQNKNGIVVVEQEGTMGHLENGIVSSVMINNVLGEYSINESQYESSLLWKQGKVVCWMYMNSRSDFSSESGLLKIARSFQ